MRVQQNPADIGRCGCGRRDYCDGSHGLSEAQWQARLAQDTAAVESAPATAPTTSQPAEPA